MLTPTPKGEESECRSSRSFLHYSLESSGDRSGKILERTVSTIVN